MPRHFWGDSDRPLHERTPVGDGLALAAVEVARPPVARVTAQMALVAAQVPPSPVPNTTPWHAATRARRRSRRKRHRRARRPRRRARLARGPQDRAGRLRRCSNAHAPSGASEARWGSISAFSARSAKARLSSSRTPPSLTTDPGSRPASSWSEIFGALRRAMPGFPSSPCHADRTEILTVPMIAFIDDHRHVYGVGPIRRVLPIALSTYHAHIARRADPTTPPLRVRPAGLFLHAGQLKLRHRRWSANVSRWHRHVHVRNRSTRARPLVSSAIIEGCTFACVAQNR